MANIQPHEFQMFREGHCHAVTAIMAFTGASDRSARRHLREVEGNVSCVRRFEKTEKGSKIFVSYEEAENVLSNIRTAKSDPIAKERQERIMATIKEHFSQVGALRAIIQGRYKILKLLNIQWL